MSYQRLIDSVDPAGLRQLVHLSLMHQVDTGNGALNLAGSSLCSNIPLVGERYKRNELYDLRISKAVVKSLIEQAQNGFSPQVSTKIGLLYRTGFGLPQSKECYLLWDVIASGYAPKVEDRVFSYRDMIKVLKAHWQQVNKSSIDPDWLYFQSQNNYYRDLLARTFSTPVEKPFLSRRKPVFAAARYEGLDCTLVYRVSSEGRANLYAAYSSIRGKLLNFTVQALKAKQIPNTLPESSVPNGFGPYFIVSGTVTIKRADQKRLCREWGQASCLDLIRQSFDQDIYSIADYKNVKLERSHPSVEFCRKYESKYNEARRFIRKNSNMNLSKNQAVLFNKAQTLVDRYTEHKSHIEYAKEEYNRIRDLDIVDKLAFIAYDAFGYNMDSRLKLVSTPYQKVHEFIHKLGFAVSPVVVVKSKNVNKIKEETDASALRGYSVVGISARLYQNGDLKNDSLNWVKLKL